MRNPCKICCSSESKYLCPRCNIPYCSLPCYQSESHVQCSEGFYKDCVVEQIKNEELDPQSRKKMLEILLRVQGVEQDLDEDETDSDDENEEENLCSRLTGIDLDDADEVWKQLTQQERHQFEELLNSGDVSEVVPQWDPWWYYRENTKLVEDLDSSALPDDSVCPLIKQDIQQLSKLSRMVPSPCVRWNVVNVVAAYALTARVYNGDHHSCALETASKLLSLSDNLTKNQVFEGPDLAVASVQLAALNSNCFIGGVDEILLKKDVERLVEGPSKSKQNHYVLAALSDVHSVLTLAKKKAKEGSSEQSGEFSKRFPKSANSSAFHVSEIKKSLKKIEFYLSWAKEFA